MYLHQFRAISSKNQPSDSPYLCSLFLSKNDRRGCVLLRSNRWCLDTVPTETMGALVVASSFLRRWAPRWAAPRLALALQSPAQARSTSGGTATTTTAATSWPWFSDFPWVEQPEHLLPNIERIGRLVSQRKSSSSSSSSSTSSSGSGIGSPVKRGHRMAGTMAGQLHHHRKEVSNKKWYLYTIIKHIYIYTYRYTSSEINNHRV